MIPRKSGHCKFHYIPKYVVNPCKVPYDESHEDLYEKEYYNALQKGLLYLKLKGVNIRMGDLVDFEACSGYRNQGVYIYNGYAIEPLEHDIDDYGSVPAKYHVIENGIPVDYWSCIGYEVYTPEEINHNPKYKRGVDHNNIVWFDHTKGDIRLQCLKNIKYGKILHHTNKELYALYTEFTHNNDNNDNHKKRYKIVYEYMDRMFNTGDYRKNDYYIDKKTQEIVIERFKTILLSNNLLICDCESGWGYKKDGYTIYVNDQSVSKYDTSNTVYPIDIDLDLDLDL